MAEYTTIGELDTASLPLTGDEYIEVEQSLTGKKITVDNIIYHPVLTIRDRGYVSGFDIYKVGNQEICIRPGVRYYTNGTLETVIEKTDFQSIAADVIDTLTASKWYGVFLSSAGVVSINTTPLTGTSVQRPTDNFYGYVSGDNTKYRHDRQGHYDGNSLCIGCIYLDASKHVTYIINNYSGTDEIGECERGSWKRFGGNAHYSHHLSIVASGTPASVTDTVSRDFPFPFTQTPYFSGGVSIRQSGLTGNVLIVSYTGYPTTTSMRHTIYDSDGSGLIDGTYYYDVTYVGPWHA
jgi:hypothetical protein